MLWIIYYSPKLFRSYKLARGRSLNFSGQLPSFHLLDLGQANIELKPSSGRLGNISLRVDSGPQVVVQMTKYKSVLNLDCDLLI